MKSFDFFSKLMGFPPKTLILFKIKMNDSLQNKLQKSCEMFIENFIKIINSQLTFNKILRKILINFDCPRGAEPLPHKPVRNWAFSIMEWLRQSV